VTDTKASSSSLARNGAVMAAGSLVSRITGFGRTVVISSALGATVLGNSYTTAQYFPQMVYELVLGGVLTSVLVPLIVKARAKDADRGEAFTHRLLTLSVLFLAVATACIVAAAPWLTELAAAENKGLVTDLGYLMLPAIFFYGICALLQAVLNTRERFAAPMWAPILNNVVIIGVGVAFFAMYTSNAATEDSITAGKVTPDMVLLLGLGTLAGIVTQSLVLWPSVRAAGFRWRWRFDFRHLHLREIGKLGGWILCYVAFNQVAMMVLIKVANTAYADRDPQVAATPGPLVYNNAYLIMMMAHGIVAVSIITALMPRLSTAASEGRFGDVAANLSSGTRLSTLALMPITVGYLALGVPLSVLLFNRGSFNLASAQATGLVVAMAGLSLIPFAISQLQTFAFYAMTDGKTVALINIPVVIVRIAASLAALAWLAPEYVVAGLMVANGLSYVVSVALSTMFLRRRVGLLGMRAVVFTWIRQIIAGAAAFAAVWAVLTVLPDATTSSQPMLLVVLAVAGVVLVAVYLAAAAVLRVPEIAEFTRLVRTKLGR
jgi:putative peptidoglycan lipid II flippase